jgi:hypothetical protein
MNAMLAPRLQYFELIRQGVDVAPLVRALERHPELWDADTLRKTGRGSPHGGMSDIWVRYNDKRPFEASGDFSAFNHAHDSTWYPAYYALPQLKPLIFDLMRQVEGERLGGVLITRIPSGCGIAAHVDRGWHVDYYDKYYLSLKSEPGANFHCGDEYINPRVGDIWRFDNRVEHWVENKSASERMTLIICIRSDRER